MQLTMRGFLLDGPYILLLCMGPSYFRRASEPSFRRASEPSWLPYFTYW